MRRDELLAEYNELQERAHELKGELRCRPDCDGICETPEVKRARQQLIEITFRMDEINEALGRDKKMAYH